MVAFKLHSEGRAFCKIGHKESRPVLSPGNPFSVGLPLQCQLTAKIFLSSPECLLFPQPMRDFGSWNLTYGQRYTAERVRGMELKSGSKLKGEPHWIPDFVQFGDSVCSLFPRVHITVKLQKPLNLFMRYRSSLKKKKTQEGLLCRTILPLCSKSCVGVIKCNGAR